MPDPTQEGHVNHAISRRTALKSAAGAAATAGLAKMLGGPAPAAAAESTPVISTERTKIVILGSQGGQNLTQVTGTALRCGTSVLIDVDGFVTVLDCGCGSAHRIAEAGYDLNRVNKVLITHCHADHIIDLGSIATLSWSSGRNGGEPDRRLKIYGPTGVDAYMRHFRKGLAMSIADQEGPLGQVPTFDKYARWHEFKPPRKAKKVYSDGHIDIRTIRVKHGSVPAVGYRIRTPDVDMVFSGDRGAVGDTFPQFAKGAEVLFHEIIDEDLVVRTLTAQGAAPTFIEHLINDHCNPATVGQVATEAGVGTLVLNHLIPGNPALTDDYWRALVAPHYSGRIIVAKDLMVV